MTQPNIKASTGKESISGSNRKSQEVARREVLKAAQNASVQKEAPQISAFEADV